MLCVIFVCLCVFSFADVHDDMNLAEDFIKSVVTHVLSTNADDIAFFNERVDTEKVCVWGCVCVCVCVVCVCCVYVPARLLYSC